MIMNKPNPFLPTNQSPEKIPSADAKTTNQKDLACGR